ncbi:hypothetical protein MAR_014663 [Mya arenaria]|uniref:Uncharacterized protein n=1 Tax=Mya arenaria TaxID=6604 RepID=A0ABY7FIH9_MYAAR|nr:hypothetical protein MAR_014663 [Mya arenaria]
MLFFYNNGFKASTNMNCFVLHRILIYYQWEAKCSTSYETKGVGTEPQAMKQKDIGAQTDHDCISTPVSLYTLDDSDSDWAPDSPPSAANMPCSEHEEANFIVYESCLNDLLTTCTSCDMCTSIQKCTIGTGLL